MKLRIVTIIFYIGYYLTGSFGNVNIEQQVHHTHTPSASSDSQIIYIDPPPGHPVPATTPAHGYFKCDCPPGLPGPRGLQGPNGIIGMPGLPGDKGKPGQNGKDGKTGPQGAQGLKGGKGDMGQQGIKGDKGSTGSMGLPGVQGNIGAIGPTGQTGPPGTPGQPGANGTPGAPGAPGQDGLNWWQQPLSPFRNKEGFIRDVTKNLDDENGFIYVGGNDDDGDDDDDDDNNINSNNNNNKHDFEATRSVISKISPNRSFRKPLRQGSKPRNYQQVITRRRKYHGKRTPYNEN